MPHDVAVFRHKIIIGTAPNSPAYVTVEIQVFGAREGGNLHPNTIERTGKVLQELAQASKRIAYKYGIKETQPT